MSRLSDIFLINGWPLVPFPLRVTLARRLEALDVQLGYCTVKWDHSPHELTVMGLKKNESGTFGFVVVHVDKFALAAEASIHASSRCPAGPPDREGNPATPSVGDF